MARGRLVRGRGEVRQCGDIDKLKTELFSVQDKNKVLWVTMGFYGLLWVTMFYIDDTAQPIATHLTVPFNPTHFHKPHNPISCEKGSDLASIKKLPQMGHTKRISHLGQ